MRTYAETITLISQILSDSTNATFATTELDALMPKGLVEVSKYKPDLIKYTLTPVASTRDITLTTEHLRKLMHDFCETGFVEYYLSGETQDSYNDRQFHNYTRQGSVITIGVDTSPLGTETVYIWLPKVHTLQQAIGTTDTAGAIKTQAAVGATSLALKSLGTGTINEDTALTIAGDSTTYTVTATATIGTNEATVTITPALTAIALVDAVVTLALATSTLDMDLEDILADYVAGLAAVNKARSYIGSIAVGGANTNSQMLEWGNFKINTAKQAMRRLVGVRQSTQYSRS